MPWANIRFRNLAPFNRLLCQRCQRSPIMRRFGFWDAAIKDLTPNVQPNSEILETTRWDTVSKCRPAGHPSLRPPQLFAPNDFGILRGNENERRNGDNRPAKHLIMLA